MISRLEAIGQMFREDPLSAIIYLVFLASTVLISLILHECAHGLVAYRCGDPTAKMMGRLSLDPRRHLDPIGTLCMLLLGFGWARPVPVNPMYFRRGRRDDFLVSIAGIVTNLFLFFLSCILTLVFHSLLWKKEFLDLVRTSESVDISMMLNPYASWIGTALTGGELETYWSYFVRNLSLEECVTSLWLMYPIRFFLMLAQINLSLAVFNLLPVPPLDGYHLVNDTLLKGKLQLDGRMFRIAQTILLILCLSGFFSRLLTVVNKTIYGLVINTLLFVSGLG